MKGPKCANCGKPVKPCAPCCRHNGWLHTADPKAGAQVSHLCDPLDPIGKMAFPASAFASNEVPRGF